MNLLDAVRQAGVVGAGGAGFPTHVKLNTKAECFIVNAAECEPLIETDKFLCRAYADEIILGVMTIAKHLEARRVVIALKGKYKEEIASLKKAISAASAPIEIFELRAFYPAGDEQTLVQQVMGVSVPERGIPIEVGAVVDNVGTVLSVADAIHEKPVTEKFLSVVGAVERPVMLKAPIGTPVTECIEKAGAAASDYAVILGGPMMGKVLSGQEAIQKAVVTKTTGNLLVLPKDHYLIRRSELPMATISRQARSACIQCRMCTDLCPRYLIGHEVRPNVVMRNLWREASITDPEEYKAIFGSAANCCDCGVCEMFACPMGLSPRKVNGYIKGQLRSRQIQVEKNTKPEARSGVDSHKTPTGRLIARLGLSQYELHEHALPFMEVQPKEVFIPFSQHIGRPAAPVVQAGMEIAKGQLLAEAAEGLSANIHASVDGIVTEVTETGARICRKGE